MDNNIIDNKEEINSIVVNIVAFIIILIILIVIIIYIAKKYQAPVINKPIINLAPAYVAQQGSGIYDEDVSGNCTKRPLYDSDFFKNIYNNNDSALIYY